MKYIGLTGLKKILSLIKSYLFTVKWYKLDTGDNKDNMIYTKLPNGLILVIGSIIVRTGETLYDGPVNKGFYGVRNININSISTTNLIGNFVSNPNGGSTWPHCLYSAVDCYYSDGLYIQVSVLADNSNSDVAVKLLGIMY